MFTKHKSEDFHFLEAGHFHAILASDWLQIYTDVLKHAGVIADHIFSSSCLPRNLGLNAFFYSLPGVNKLLDVHPDFIKHAGSERFLWLGLKIGFLFQTYFAGSRSVLTKVKARAQTTARASSSGGQFSIRERARAEFTAWLKNQ